MTDEVNESENSMGPLRLLIAGIGGAGACIATKGIVGESTEHILNQQGYDLQEYQDCNGPPGRKECFTEVDVSPNPFYDQTVSQDSADFEYGAGIVGSIVLSYLVGAAATSSIALGPGEVFRILRDYTSRIFK